MANAIVDGYSKIMKLIMDNASGCTIDRTVVGLNKKEFNFVTTFINNHFNAVELTRTNDKCDVMPNYTSVFLTTKVEKTNSIIFCNHSMKYGEYIFNFNK